MRLVGAALLGLVLWGFAAGASAQNGLQRFESDIKPQLEVKKFTYGSASALGSAGFVLNDVVAVIPGNPATGDKDSTVKIDKVTVDELDFDRLKKGASDAAAALRQAQDRGHDGRRQPWPRRSRPTACRKCRSTSRSTIASTPPPRCSRSSKLEVNLRGEARDRAGAGAGRHQRQVEPDAGQQPRMTAGCAQPPSRSSTPACWPRSLPAIAKEQGTTAEAMVAMAMVPLAGFSDGPGVADPEGARTPWCPSSPTGSSRKGPIKIAIKPAKTASVADLEKVMEPNALTDHASG